MPNGYPRDRFFYPTLTLMIDSYMNTGCVFGWLNNIFHPGLRLFNFYSLSTFLSLHEKKLLKTNIVSGPDHLDYG